ncbi:MAG: DUF2304 domain-containing protein [Propionibacteriaceae bacterium]|jgi:hypothetical protein|nr:DUF2304 domain-containing protein [Propionibacteriaceae bacterium]
MGLPVTLSVLGVALAVVLAAAVLRMVARRTLDLRYASLWIVVAVGVAVVACWPELLVAVSSALGFQAVSNFMFVVVVVLLLLVSLRLSMELTKAELRIQRLAEELAILKQACPGQAASLEARPSDEQTGTDLRT